MVSFSWFFNNSDHREELSETRFTSEGLISSLDFAPSSNKDYGTLYCQGENVIGMQEEPCAFQIVPTGKSDFNCLALLVKCGPNQSQTGPSRVHTCSWGRTQGGGGDRGRSQGGEGGVQKIWDGQKKYKKNKNKKIKKIFLLFFWKNFQGPKSPKKSQNVRKCLKRTKKWALKFSMLF